MTRNTEETHGNARLRGEHGIYQIPESAYALSHSGVAASEPFNALDPLDWELLFGHLVAHGKEGVNWFTVGYDRSRSYACELRDALKAYLRENNAIPVSGEDIHPLPFKETLIPESEKPLYERVMRAWEELKCYEEVTETSEPMKMAPKVSTRRVELRKVL